MGRVVVGQGIVRYVMPRFCDIAVRADWICRGRGGRVLLVSEHSLQGCKEIGLRCRSHRPKKSRQVCTPAARRERSKKTRFLRPSGWYYYLGSFHYLLQQKRWVA